jgi:site-specific DNA recombinase
VENKDLTSIIRQIVENLSPPGALFLGTPQGEQAFAYARVSTSGQAEEGRSGLPRQLQNIHQKAIDLGLCIPIHHIYFDDHTGFEFKDRPGLQQLIRAVGMPDRTAHHLVIEYIDRLSRNAKWHQGYLLDFFTENNISIHFWKSFSSEIERAVMGAISEMGMRDEIARMVRGTQHKAESGRITAKIRAYGFDFVDSQGRLSTDPTSNYRKDTYYAINQDEASIVREIYHRLIAGDSLYEICNNLNERGVPTPRSAKAWASGNISKMLKNPLYKGEFIANQRYIQKEWSERNQKIVLRQRNRPVSEWITVKVPTIVSPQVWDEAQKALQRNYKKSTRNAKGEWLLQGFLRCDCCGLFVQIGSRNGKKVKGQAIKRRYYICGSYTKPPTIREKICCKSPIIYTETIDEHVWASVCQLITEPDIIINYLEEQTEKVVAGGLNDQLVYIERQIEKCNREEKQWDLAFAHEIFGIEEYKDKKSTVQARKESLEEEHGKLLEELSLAQVFERKREVIREQLEKMRAQGIALDLAFKDKRRILSMLVDLITINTKEKRYRIEGVLEGTYNFVEAVTGTAAADQEIEDFTYSSAGRNTPSALWRSPAPGRTTC